MSIVVVVILTSAWTTMALDRSTTATAALAWPYSGAARKSTSSSGPRRRRGGYGRWYKRRPRDYPAEGTEVESSPPHTGSRSGPKEALRVSVTPPKHVPHQASMQRLLANEKVMRAQDDHRHDVPHSQRHDCLGHGLLSGFEFAKVWNQGQNLLLFATIGVLLWSYQRRTTMNAYVYHEGEGGKGGNNVASLLWKDVHDRGWIDKNKGPRQELTIIQDNCTGQNKNRHGPAAGVATGGIGNLEERRVRVLGGRLYKEPLRSVVQRPQEVVSKSGQHILDAFPC